MARILSIDYGLKRVGLAVSDPLQLIANGLDTVTNAKFWEYLNSYMQAEEVETIVVGYPQNLDGSPTDITQAVDQLVLKLAKTFPGKNIVKQDERFTSVDAKRIILQSGARKKKRRDKGLVDKVSAILILQDYMESIR